MSQEASTAAAGHPSTLVVGGGFLGAHLATALGESGTAVRVLSRASRGWGTLANLDPKLPIETIAGDVGDVTVLRQALDGVERVFHAVGVGAPGTSHRDLGGDIERHLVPFVRFLDVARDAGVRRVVLASSGGTVYGPARSLPITEDHPTAPVSGYGALKLACEKYLALFQALAGIETIALRLSNVYGDGQDTRSGFGVITAFIDRLHRGQPVELWGAGEVVRDFLHVDDATQAAVLALSMAVDGPATFNIGSGTGTSLADLIKTLEAVAGMPVPIHRGPARPYDVPTNVLNSSRFSHATGWRPRVDLAAGLRRALAAARDGGTKGPA